MTFPSKSKTLTACVALAAAAAALAFARPASAAAKQSSFAASLSQTVDLGTYTASGVDAVTSSRFDFTVHAKATWNASLSTNVGWHDDLVRQGGNVGVGSMSPL